VVCVRHQLTVIRDVLIDNGSWTVVLSEDHVRGQRGDRITHYQDRWYSVRHCVFNLCRMMNVARDDELMPRGVLQRKNGESVPRAWEALHNEFRLFTYLAANAQRGQPEQYRKQRRL
jgi:hypothetical protein